MAGKTIRILEKTLYDKFGDNLAASGYVKVWVATNVPVDGYVYGALVLRVHSWTTATGTPSVAVAAFPSAPTPEDPATTFRGTTALIDGSTNGKIAYSATVAGTVTVVGQNIGLSGTYTAGSQFVDIQLIVQQGTTLNSPMVFTVSADLVLRS